MVRPIAAAAPGEPSGEPSPPTSSSRPATRTSHPPRRRSWPNGPTQSWRSSRTPPSPCSSPSQASPPGSLNEPRRRRPDTRSGCSTRSPAITTKGATVSNHFSADKLKFPGDDPRLDLTDLFVFKTSDHADTTMLIIDVNQFMTAPCFPPDAVYQISIDTDGAAHADVAFTFTFSEFENGMQTETARYATGPQAQCRGLKRFGVSRGWSVAV